MAKLLTAILALTLLAACGSGADEADEIQPLAGTTGATDEPSASATGRPANTPTVSTTTAASLSVTSPVARGGSATARVGTAPNAKCTITYTTPSGTRSEAAGLDPKAADAKGELSWTWVISPSTNPGNATVRVTCDGQAVTATIVIS